jgi:hypothetical protein
VARLRFIQHAQDLGFSLNEIQELGPTGTRRRTRGSPWTKRPSISPCGNFSSTSA